VRIADNRLEVLFVTLGALFGVFFTEAADAVDDPRDDPPIPATTAAKRPNIDIWRLKSRLVSAASTF